MTISYKTYSDTKEAMKKFVNKEEGAIIYSISRNHLMTLAQDAGAVYRVGKSALINTQIFEEYLEQFREASRPLPKHTCNIRKGENDNE